MNKLNNEMSKTQFDYEEFSKALSETALVFSSSGTKGLSLISTLLLPAADEGMNQIMIDSIRVAFDHDPKQRRSGSKIIENLLFLRDKSLKYPEAKAMLEKHRKEIIHCIASNMIVADEVANGNGGGVECPRGPHKPKVAEH